MQRKIILLAACAVFPLFSACTKSESNGDQTEEILEQVEDMDIEQKAEDAAAEIDEASADEALNALEEDLAGD